MHAKRELQIPLRRGARLEGAAVPKNDRYGSKEYFHIHLPRPIGHIAKIEQHPLDDLLAGVGRPTRAGYLRQARYARTGVVAADIAAIDRRKLPIMRQGVRPRTDDGHVAHQHIDELRQLVDAVPAQETTQRGRTIIALSSLCDVTAFAGFHRAEFENVERPTLKSSTTLAEQARPGAFKPDQDPDAQQDRRQKDQCAAGAQDVEQSLGWPSNNVFIIAPRPRPGMALIDWRRVEVRPVAFGPRSKKPSADGKRGTVSNFH